MLLEIVLDDSEMTSYRIFENEEDYESLLDEICVSNNLKEDLGLHLKINILNVLRDVHPDSSKIEPLLNKLLDINQKLLLTDWERSNFDDGILRIPESSTVEEEEANMGFGNLPTH